MKTIQFLIFLFFTVSLMAQDVIELRNPSFEDYPRCCTSVRGWFGCGGEERGTPDVQPGWFGADLPAIDGYTYIGMVARDDDTWEAVSQRMTEVIIKKGRKYWFSTYLAYTPDMISISRITKKDVKYNKPLKLRIWGGNGGYCKKDELLAESALIDHEEWQEYQFIFEPQENHAYITFEAFYNTPTLVPYNGNLHMDHCSDIIEVDGSEDFASGKFIRENNPKSRDNGQPLPKVEPMKVKKTKKEGQKAISALKKAHKISAIEDSISAGNAVSTQEILDLYHHYFNKQKIKYDSSETAGIHSQQLLWAHELESKTLKAGLRNYIFNHSATYTKALGEGMQAIGYQSSGEVILKALDIISRQKKGEELTNEEYQYFRKSDDLLKQTFAEEKSKVQMSSYVDKNKEGILLELRTLLEQ